MTDYLEKMERVAVLLEKNHTLPEAFMVVGVPIDHGIVCLIADAAGCDDDRPAEFLLRLGREESRQAVARAIVKQRDMGEVKALPRVRYVVKYYDAKLSKKGQGVQFRSFANRAAAEEFASKNRIYGDPCKVEERSE